MTGVWPSANPSDRDQDRAPAEGEDQPDKPSRLRALTVPVHAELPPAVRDERAFSRALARALGPLVSREVRSFTRPDAETLVRGRPRRRGPAARRGWHLLLVVDASPTFLAVWADAVPRLARLLRRQPAFDHVSIARLVADEPNGRMRLRGGLPGDASRGAPSWRAAVGRRVIWLVTDGLGPAWRGGDMAAVLSHWADAGPVAILDVLNAPLWRWTDLGARRVRIRGAGRGAAGRIRFWRHAGLRPDADGDTDTDTDPGAGAQAPWEVSARAGTLVPVIGFDVEWIAYWARYVAATEPVWFETTAVIADDLGPLPRQREDAPPPPPDRLADFAAAASPAARRLAGLLAAVEAVDHHGLCTIAGIAGAERRDVTEVFAAGLLAPRAGLGRAGDAVTRFAIATPARWMLRGTLSRADVVRVCHALGLVDHDGRPTAPTPGDAPPGPHDPQRRPPVPVGRATHGPANTTESDSTFTMGSAAGVEHMSSHQEGGRTEATEGVTARDRPEGGRVRLSATLPVPTLPGPGRLPRIWGSIPPRNPHFTGREDLLADLDTRLAEGVATVLPETLRGMGGVGKTQLATEYVYRHLSDFDVIWWIPAEQSVQIGNAFTELGARLGLDVGTEATVAVRRVVEALRLGDPYGRWLLVFDNAEDPQSVREYFPASATGRILVTSRDPSWAHVSRPLEVDVFRREESVQLLRSRGAPLADADADRVAAALGDLPLAIETAATWRAETGMSAGEYLRLLEDKLTDLLGTPPADYPQPVTAAWNVALDRLAQSNPAALELLQVCASFAPAPISRQLLSRAHNEKISPALDEALRDPVKLSRAIRDVNRYALARIDHRDNSIVMHRLVQAVLIGRMTPEQQGTMRHGAHVLLAASDPNDPSNSVLWSSYADLYPHVVASNTERCRDPRVRQLLLNLCDYLWSWGDHQGSSDFARLVYDAWEAGFGEEDPYTQQMGLRVGWGLVAVGRYAEAAEINRRTFELSRRVNGPDAELTNILMGSVGTDLRWRGEFAAALEIAEDAYARATRDFGSDDPQTLSTAQNVAVCLRLLGRFTEAATLADDTWQRQARLFGEDDSQTLNTLTGLNVDRRELGDYLGALAEQEKIDARYRRKPGISADHPARLHSSRYLAVANRRAGNHAAALELSRDVEERSFHRYGGEHPASLASALGLSIDLRHAGSLHEARAVCTRTLLRYAARIGDAHPHTLTAAVNLAIIDRLSGQVEAALERDERTLAAFVERLGDAHPSTLATGANLASDLYMLGRFEEAYDHDSRTLSSAITTLGEAHPSTLAVSANLAIDLRALERTEEALDLQARTLSKVDAVLGREHPAARQIVAWIRLDCDLDPVPI